MARSSFLSEEVREYLVELAGIEPELVQDLRRETQGTEFPGMQIGADQGRFLALLVELIGAKKAIEVGVFTGFSSLCIASAMPAQGRLVACDVNETWTGIARRYWERAGVAERIELHLRPALDTLSLLIADEGPDSFDFCFIDADKANYDAYYERCLELTRPGGLIAVDNALWGGRVTDVSDTTPDTAAIRALNAKVCADPRVTAALIAVGDGVLLARKRD